MKYNGPKVKVSRALGIPLTPKAAKVMERKSYPPGQHGRYSAYKRKDSDYKRQLLEKQRLRAQYNIHERQMRNYYKKASRKYGNTAENLVQMLETRLDAVVYRAGFARTIYAARQYVSHKHIEVNGQRVNIASYGVKVGDVISVKEKSRKIPCFSEALESTGEPPAYLTRNKDEMSATLNHLPARGDIPIICDISLVIEYYSR